MANPGIKNQEKTQHSIARRGPTGPRTMRGKLKSRYNAVKHGIFANVVLRGTVLKESKQDYLNLLESFQEQLQPVGGLEEFLVEKLAQLAWRKARAVKAEAAIVMKQTEFFREDRDLRLKGASGPDMLSFVRFTGGMARSQNPHLVAKSLQTLELLKNVVAGRGFEPETDERLLEGVYGEAGRIEDLFLTYKRCSDRGKAAGESAHSARLVDEAKEEFRQAVEAEMKRIEGHMADLEARENEELPLLEESLAIPEDKELDRLLRYEARLDGAFDRTLTQLERLQRLRLGQPLPPPVKVEVAR